MTPPPRREPGRDLDSLTYALRVLRWRWRPLVVAVAACMLAAFAWFETHTRTYQATANVAFGTSNLSQTALQVDTNSADPEREAATKVVIARSPEVAAAVAKQLNTGASPQDLIRDVDVSTVPNANVLAITASADDPASAVRLANAFAGQYIAFEAKAQIEGIRQAESDLQQQLDNLPSGSSDRPSLEASLQRLAQLRAVASADSRVIGWASPPKGPAGLSGPITLILGAIIGLAVGLTLVFLVEAVDRRVRSMEEFEGEYRVPALAGVPAASFRGRTAFERREALEPFRILRSAIDFVGVTRELDALMVTSAVPGEGKTTVSVDLAQVYALTGRRVVLVEMDLRRPSFGEHFPIDGRQGVTTALTRRVPVHDLLQQPFTDLPELCVLPSGIVPPNPSELLGAEVTADLLRELRADGAMVIIDAPPLNPVADAQVLLNVPGVDGALLVGRIGLTTRDEVRRARAILDRHALQPMGIVVTGLQDAERYGYEPYEGAAAPRSDLASDLDPLSRRPAARRISS